MRFERDALHGNIWSLTVLIFTFVVKLWGEKSNVHEKNLSTVDLLATVGAIYLQQSHPHARVYTHTRMLGGNTTKAYTIMLIPLIL